MTSNALVVRSHPACLFHTPPLGFPETPGRLRHVLQELTPGKADPWSLDAEAQLPPEEDTLGVLRWIHSTEYIERVRVASETIGSLDSPDCPIGPGTFEAAMAAAGLSLSTALEFVNNRVWRAFLAVRPLAHHAEESRTRGFGVFNHVALAAEVVVKSWVKPVLIVDFDGTHGNGTQSLFYDREDVGYVSVHQYPFFPGTGGADEVGEGPGEGTTRNVPLVAGSGDAEYVAAIESAIETIAGRIRPAALIVSAGFTAHVDDPVGGMMVTDDGFVRLAEIILRTARKWAGGRILSFLEGGFHPGTVARNVRNHVRTLATTEEENAILH